MTKAFAVLSVVALVACSRGGGTVSGPTDTTEPSEQTIISTTTFVAPADEGGGPGPTSVVCQGYPAVCTFTTTMPHKVRAVCTTPGKHDNLGSWSSFVKTGDTVTPLDICTPPSASCEPVTVRRQIDFSAGQGEHIGHLSNYPITFPAGECEPEPEPSPDPEPECDSPLPAEGDHSPISGLTNPASECGHFGAPVAPPTMFLIYKAANDCYWISHTDIADAGDTIPGFCPQADGPRQISHETECGCPAPRSSQR